MNEKQTIIAILTAILLTLSFGMVRINEKLSDIRAINSGIRDDMNVQNCFILNDNDESFENCLNDYY